MRNYGFPRTTIEHDRKGRSKGELQLTRDDGDGKELANVGTELKNLCISQIIPCTQSCSRLPETSA